MASLVLLQQASLYMSPARQTLEAACDCSRHVLSATHSHLRCASAAAYSSLILFLVAGGCTAFIVQRCPAAARHGHWYHEGAVSRTLVRISTRHRKENRFKTTILTQVSSRSFSRNSISPYGGCMFSFVRRCVTDEVISTARMSEHVSEISGKHRNPIELQAALKVINDQLADANDLERPALELVAQKLTEELLEVEREEDCKQGRQSGKEAQRPACGKFDPSEGSRHSSTCSSSGVPVSQDEPLTEPKSPSQGEPRGGSDEEGSKWKTFFTNIPRVQIANGTQKYVLIKVSPERNPNKHVKESFYLVRGNPTVEYHYQCALDTMKELENVGAEGEVVGGGRIECRMKEKEVEIYGHSYQFGRADHAITAQLIKDAFGSDFQVSWGDYGY